MVSILFYTIAIIYFSSLVYITIYCLLQFHLLFHYKKLDPILEVDEIKTAADADLPFVTIQLPIYNEYYVIERLIDNITQLDYPKDKFEIHILDDSTDDTVLRVKKKVDQYKQLGFNIDQIQRENRVGFKAGALKDGMSKAKGEFIAIFDADFLPNKDFLRKTLPHFSANNVGVVQTRWEHINQDYSLITRLQAFQLNVHFTVEQEGREKGDYMLQFNGTAGVWRRQTIEDAGGWEADTLTEDLDLSYRAQLKGWKIVFLEDCVSPAELPAEMNGLKAQQYRWMKGGAETAKKMLPTVWKSKLSIVKKIHATVHLLSSSVFLFVFILGIFSVPLLFAMMPLGIDSKYLAVFLISLLSVSIVYYTANVGTAWKKENKIVMIMKFILLFPIFLALSMGLSLHNSIAVLQGYLGKKTAFVRTPKFNILDITDSFKKSKYSTKLSKVTIFEGLLSLYFLFGIYQGISIGNSAFLLLHILLMLGYGTIFYYSVRHSR